MPTLSPIIRDAMHMQSLANNNPGGRGTLSGKIEINCDLGVAKWLFGIMEEKELKDLCDTSKAVPLEELASFLETEEPTIPSPIVLRRVLQTADFYDFPFFPRLMKSLLYQLSDLGAGFALSAATVAVLDLKDTRLAIHAVRNLLDLPKPISFDRDVVKAIGADVWWPLVRAYSEVMDQNAFEAESIRNEVRLCPNELTKCIDIIKTSFLPVSQ